MLEGGPNFCEFYLQVLTVKMGGRGSLNMLWAEEKSGHSEICPEHFVLLNKTYSQEKLFCQGLTNRGFTRA